MTSPGHNTDALQKVLDDHTNIKYCYEQVQANSDVEGKKWFNELLWTIARHAATEELVVYPLLDKLGSTGHALAEKSREDHQKTKEALSALDGKDLTPEVRLSIDQMMTDLLEHIAMEEGPGGDLEVLGKAYSLDELQAAGKKYERTKKLVPTHPHPGAPDKPPFLTLAGLLAAPIDKLRDAFRSFPDEADH